MQPQEAFTIIKLLNVINVEQTKNLCPKYHNNKQSYDAFIIKFEYSLFVLFFFLFQSIYKY